MIVQNSSPPTDITADYSWKSPIPKRTNFDRLVLWSIVLLFGCGSCGLGLYGLYKLPPRGYCGTCLQEIEAEKRAAAKAREEPIEKVRFEQP